MREGKMVRRVLVSIFFLSLLIGLSFWLVQPEKRHEVIIAAGPASGEAYGLLKALQTVAHRHYPEVSIEVFETRDDLQNISLLAEGRVDLAAVQADLLSNGSSRLICELYPNMFQLVVRPDSGINSVADLVGKRVALPFEDSGEYASFLFLAQHYGLTASQMKLLTGSERTADWLFINGDVDAVFRVRGAGNSSILNLIEKAGGRIVPIPQAAALQLRRPALSSGIIPEGSYKGHPTIPEDDTPTVAAKKLLLAHSDVPDNVIYKLVSVFFENRRELVELNSIAGAVSLPDRSTGTLFPIHKGAQTFMDRDKPTTLQQYAPAIALAVSLSLLYLSASLQVANWRRRKAMSQYNSGLLALAERARTSESYAALEECRSELFGFVQQIVAAGESGKISTADLALFNKVYETVEEAIKQRRLKLEGAIFHFDAAKKAHERRIKQEVLQDQNVS